MDGGGRLALTEELVARAHCVVEEVLPENLVYASDADHAEEVAELLASRPEGQGFWLFAYGSLLWKPACAHAEEVAAVAPGWHRSFCMRIEGHRGTPERPGLMMALDRGGTCRGLACRLPENTLEDELDKLVRREMPVKRMDGIPFHRPRWIPVRTEAGTIKALAFVINRNGPHYAGRPSPAETADILATACGYAGSCAEYLHNTVQHLHALGIRDRNLSQLASLVAERLTDRL